MMAPGACARSKAWYQCGPVQLCLAFEEPWLRGALHGLLNQYDAPWPAPEASVQVTIENGIASGHRRRPTGAYLHSQHLRADREGSHLYSASNLGVWMDYDFCAGQARLTVPPDADRQTLVEETEQQLVLLLARAWAQQGWTPLHAGSLVPGGETRCVLLCAPSGVGKTTLTAALLRRGWRTLGDDKILLRPEGKGVAARSLARRFHLHPSTARWFPEAGDFSAWPRYSRWTDKRVVPIEGLWPGRLLEAAFPAAAVQLERSENGLAIEPLSQMATLNALLRQLAIPSTPEHARPLVSCIAAMAANIQSARIKLGNDAFADAPVVERLDAALRNLLS
jgi:hypothetical protein